MLNIILIFIGLMAFAQSATCQGPCKGTQDLVQSLNQQNEILREILQASKETRKELKKQTVLLEKISNLHPEGKKPNLNTKKNKNRPPSKSTQEGNSPKNTNISKEISRIQDIYKTSDKNNSKLVVGSNSTQQKNPTNEQKNVSIGGSNSSQQKTQEGTNEQKNVSIGDSNSSQQKTQEGTSEQKNELVGVSNSTQEEIEECTSQRTDANESAVHMQKILERILEGITLMNSKRNCLEATSITKVNGIYNIRIATIDPTVVSVPCYNDYGGGWLVFQRRKDGSVDFNRGWEDYKNGFGDVRGEFFLGLEKLYAITNETPHELLIVLKDNGNNTFYAKYDEFAIGDESQSYALNVLGSYSGNATDSLLQHKSSIFSTKDKHNDTRKKVCPVVYNSGWWFYSNSKFCYRSNLNGLYKPEIVYGYLSGIDWILLKGKNKTLGFTEMMVRPKTIKLIL